MGFFVVPKASEGFNNFRYTYLKGGGKEAMLGDNTDVYRQISDDEFIYVIVLMPNLKRLLIFSLEKFKNQKLVHKITASRIKYDPRNVNISYTIIRKER
jgi:lipopolysaccharide export system permease protein